MTLFTFNKGDDGMKVVEEAIKKEEAICKQLEEKESIVQQMVKEAIVTRVGALLQAVRHYGHFQVKPHRLYYMEGVSFEGGTIHAEDGSRFKITDLLLADEKTTHLVQRTYGHYDDHALDHILYQYENWLLFFSDMEEIKFTVTENEVVLRDDEA